MKRRKRAKGGSGERGKLYLSGVHGGGGVAKQIAKFQGLDEICVPNQWAIRGLKQARQEKDEESK